MQNPTTQQAERGQAYVGGWEGGEGVFGGGGVV